jgi:hypothetical protein
MTLALGLGANALAHEEHCHTKGADGKLEDAPDAKTKKDCLAKNGLWEHHHAHCHKTDAAGKLQDIKGPKDEKACTAKGGTWVDHGHEPDKK